MELTKERIDELDRKVMNSKLDNIELQLRLVRLDRELAELEETESPRWR